MRCGTGLLDEGEVVGDALLVVHEEVLGGEVLAGVEHWWVQEVDEL